MELDLLAEEYADEPAYQYQGFISTFICSLVRARHAAGLTQAQVAEMLHTTQSAIARFERDHTGRASLRRVTAYALAVGVQPWVSFQVIVPDPSPVPWLAPGEIYGLLPTTSPIGGK